MSSLKYEGAHVLRPLSRTLSRRVSLSFVFVYVFFLLFPHFDAVTHTHEGGAESHHHSFLSAHDVALERAVLAVAPEGRPQGELAQQARLGTKSTVKRSVKTQASTPSLKNGSEAPHQGPHFSDPDRKAHTHLQEDPNLPTLGSAFIASSLSSAALPEPATVPGFVPALAILASPARAPPRA